MTNKERLDELEEGQKINKCLMKGSHDYRVDCGGLYRTIIKCAVCGKKKEIRGHKHRVIRLITRKYDSVLTKLGKTI